MKNILDKLIIILLLIYTISISSTYASQVKNNESFSQEIIVKGKVTSQEDGNSLPGVNIFIKGTASGTISDSEGNYALEIPNENVVLVFSFIGYTSEELAVSGRTIIDVAMVPDIKQLSEIVVIGYGTQERKDLTGAIASVSGDDLQKGPAAGLDQALQGKIAGVQVTSSSGRPGAPINVQIRGVGTIGSTDPLYVIDGVPVYQDNKALGASNISLMSMINPNDIESLDVLKDASAAAIYGARAANGVVIITTKRGKSGKTKIDLDIYSGVQNVYRTLDVLNSQQYSQFLHDVHVASGSTVIPEFARNPSAVTVNTNWQDLIYRTAPIRNINLNLSGGNEYSNFAVSGGYFTQEGILVGTSFERYSLRVNSDFNRGNFLFGESVSLSKIAEDPGCTDGSIVRMAMTASPAMPVYDPTKKGGYGVPLAINGVYNNEPNPFALQNLYDGHNERYRALANLYGEYEIVKGLSYRLNVGLDYITGNNRLFIPTFEMGLSNKSNPNDARLSEGRTWTNTLVTENLLKYGNQWGKHNISTLLGYTTQTYSQDALNLSIMDFHIEALQKADNASKVENWSGSGAEWSLLSYLGRVNYSFDDKYLFTGSIRRDGSSRFSKNNKWGLFPSFSLGWRISKEDILKDLTFIDDLKLRYSWGETGNQEISNYGFLHTLNPFIRYPFGIGSDMSFAIGQAPTSFGNPNLKWETVIQNNIGIDATLFDNRVSFTADYFIKDTKDMLIQIPIPTYSGVMFNPYVNAGSVRNSGLELSLSYRKTKGDFLYSFTGNITSLHNEVKSLSGGEGIFGQDNYTYTDEGKAIGSFYGWIADGIFQTQEEINTANAINPNRSYQDRAIPGDIRFKDLDGDGTITANDRTFTGNPIPDILYSLNANFAYKGLDLSVFFQGVHGNEIYNHNRCLIEAPSGNEAYRNRGVAVLNAWNGPNTSTTVPRLGLNDFNDNDRISNLWVEDGSFLRLKNITLGYVLPSNIIKPIEKLNKVRIYASASNLLTFTKYSGLDPEIGNTTQVAGNGNPTLLMGVDRGVYPQSRTLTMGLQVNF